MSEEQQQATFGTGKTLTEKVLAQLDIVEMIGKDSTLKPGANGDFLCCCPIHGEKNPSMSVSVKKQVYHCKSCGATGNAVHYYAARNDIEYRDALIELGRSLGVIAKRGKSSDQENMELLAGEYQKNLFRSQKAIDYLSKRKMTPETINSFGIGFSTGNEFNTVPGIADTGRKLGLLRANDQGREYAFFYRRIMFPIWDKNGTVVGFAGRDSSGTSQAKYINSPESEGFKKSGILYGLNKAARSIRENKTAIVLEGYMDVAILHQEGITNTVSVMGTSINETLARELFEISDTIVLCLDGDKAGQDAMLRDIDVIAPLMMDGKLIKIALMPIGYDPDEYVIEHGAQAFRDLCEKAVPCSEFMMTRAAEKHDLSTVEHRCHFNLEIKRQAEMFVNAPTFAKAMIEQAEIFSLTRALEVEMAKTNLDPDKIREIVGEARPTLRQRLTMRR